MYVDAASLKCDDTPLHPGVDDDTPRANGIDASRLVRRAGNLVDLRQFDRALALLRTGRRQVPDDPALLLLHGICLWEKGWIGKAEQSLDRAARLAPDNATLQFNLGAFLGRKRRFAQAIVHLRRSCELRPGNYRFLSTLGGALRMSGAMESAEEALQSALQIKSGDTHAHFELGLCRMARDDITGALAALERAVELNPDEAMHGIIACGVRQELAAQGSRRPGAKRIVLHLNQPLHISILGPVFEQLKDRHHVRITNDPRLAGRFRPDLVVVADAQADTLRPFAPDATYIYVRHGLITKNHAFKAASKCDYLAGVSSPAIRDLAVRHGGFNPDRVWVTGYVQMDPLFRGTPLPCSVALPAGRRTVLFAPTYNVKLSAAPMLGRRVVELIRGDRDDLNIIIKPHPITWRVAPTWLKYWRRAARVHDRVYLVDDPAADAMALLQRADVLISDACSMAFAYLALDRPIILLTNPERTSDPNYDPVGIEWLWRDLGEELFDAAQLPAAVERAIEQPKRHAERRAHYRRLVFGDLTDGRAAERIAEHIDRLPLHPA
jgi:Flp pilus assembly protein TadD